LIKKKKKVGRKENETNKIGEIERGTLKKGKLTEKTVMLSGKIIQPDESDLHDSGI